jgi:hypothetical protein
MAGLENEAREEGMKEVLTCMNLLHPILYAVKGNKHQAPRTQIMFWNNRYTIIGN